MGTDWLSEYLLLALRMDRSLAQVETSPFIDTYYGPSGLKQSVQGEPPADFAVLVRDAAALLSSLPGESFSAARKEFLAKHLLALMTIAELRCQEEFSFYELVERVFDIQPIWVPEEEFEEWLEMINRALPGKGEVRSRFQDWMESIRILEDRVEDAIPVMQAILSEVRQRTQSIISLPEGENLDLQPVRGVNYGAANWYQGGYRSRLELNLDRPIYLPGLLYQMCHEGYPGHHTESCSKEFHLFHEKGYLEQSVFFTFGPQLVIAEGIASLAPGMIFTPKEAAEWIREEFQHLVKPEALDVDLELILEAMQFISPDELGSNLATLIEAGRKEADVMEYALAYSIYSKDQITDHLSWLASPLTRLYSFSYSHGKRLILPLVQPPARKENIHMLLTEQLTPGQIARMLHTGE